MIRLAGLALFVVLFLVGATVLRTGVGQALFGRPSFTKSVEIDRGTYFRLKVKLTYRGKPQDFDIVVGCNVRQTNYRDNSRSVEVGMVPEVFGRRMDDGKALAIKPPQACHGETTGNGGAPPDLLPMVIVYDNAENLAFGTAYLSEDAYESRLSVLTFGGSTIEKATRAEFDEFRATQQNVLTHEMYQRRISTSPPKDVARWGTECFGYARYRLPDDLRAMVRKNWPPSKPRFWGPSDGPALKEIWGALRANNAVRSDGANSPAHAHRDFANALEFTERGLRTRSGRGQLNSRPVLFPPAVYPDADGWGLPPWPRDPVVAVKDILDGSTRVETDVDFHGGLTKGFGYCRANVNHYGPPAIDATTPVTNKVDGEAIYNGGVLRTRAIIFLERDEFIFERFELPLFSGRGDA
jgi:hypothetical protein